MNPEDEPQYEEQSSQMNPEDEPQYEPQVNIGEPRTDNR
jgi:hypothetical protein